MGEFFTEKKIRQRLSSLLASSWFPSHVSQPVDENAIRIQLAFLCHAPWSLLALAHRALTDIFTIITSPSPPPPLFTYFHATLPASSSLSPLPTPPSLPMPVLLTRIMSITTTTSTTLQIQPEAITFAPRYRALFSYVLAAADYRPCAFILNSSHFSLILSPTLPRKSSTVGVGIPSISGSGKMADSISVIRRILPPSLRAFL